MSKITLVLAVAAILAATISTPVSAQTQRNTKHGAVPAAVQMRGLSADRYVQKSAMSDLFEVESSKLALQRSQNAEVKDFAQRMISDHTKSTQKLEGLLQSASLATAPPTELDRAHQRMLQKLQNAPAAQFDRLYMQVQVKGHNDALKVQQGYERNGGNDQLKAFAGDVSPMVQDHLAQARQILSGLGHR